MRGRSFLCSQVPLKTQLGFLLEVPTLAPCVWSWNAQDMEMLSQEFISITHCPALLSQLPSFLKSVRFSSGLGEWAVAVGGGEKWHNHHPALSNSLVDSTNFDYIINFVFSPLDSDSQSQASGTKTIFCLSKGQFIQIKIFWLLISSVLLWILRACFGAKNMILCSCWIGRSNGHKGS